MFFFWTNEIPLIVFHSYINMWAKSIQTQKIKSSQFLIFCNISKRRDPIVLATKNMAFVFLMLYINQQDTKVHHIEVQYKY